MEYGNLYDFLRDAYRKDSSTGIVFYENREFFVGKAPFDKGSYNGYQITAIDKSTISLEKKLDYGVLKKKIKISRLKNKVRLDLLYKVIAQEDVFPELKPDSCSQILLEFLNNNDYEHFSDFLNKTIKGEMKKQWEMAKRIFISCQKETEAANSYNFV